MPLPDDSVLAAADETTGKADRSVHDLLLREQELRGEAVDLLAQLVDERARVNAIVQQMPAGVIVAEAPSGDVVLANEQADEIWGSLAAGADAQGAHLAAFRPDGRPYDPEDWPLARAVRRGETVVSEEIDVLSADGALRTISMSAVPVVGRDGRVAAGVAIFHDITERKRVEERGRFLADASEALSASLDAGEILTSLAEMAVPRLADFCAVDVRAEDGSVHRHVALSAAGEGGGPTPLDEDAVPRPLRTGESEVYRDVAEAARTASALDAEPLARLRALGATSYMCVPLIARGGVVAAISFVAAESGRRYSQADVEVAEELARRAALAVENARLYAKLGAERDRLRRLLERLRQGVVTVSRDLRIEFANEEARHALGVETLAEGDRLPEPWPELSLRNFAASLFAGADPVERRVHAGEKTYDVVGIPAQESDTAVLVLADISEREQLERAEREFVTNAAHELRTPLAAMTTSIEVLQAGAKEKPEERDLFLAHIERECARLRRLAHALLVLARAQTGQQTPQRAEIELVPLLDEVRAGLAAAGLGEIDVSCEPGLTILGDRDLLEQTMWNLGTNAAKYASGAPVVLAARRVHGGRVEIEVRDTGPGIPIAERKRVFERFYRSGARDSDGFGLGLAIVRQAVDALGGSVELGSGPDGGTSARVTLPAGSASA